ncbi:MAG: hypothetical protein KJZ54_13255 [Phycisphaerales bacterium]|nr:hypothetical protein [Phycisphaerales bacterium]
MRRVRLIAAFMAIGAVVNVLVAWACALWSPLDYRRMSFDFGVDASLLAGIPSDWLRPPSDLAAPVLVSGERRTATAPGIAIDLAGVTYLTFNGFPGGPSRFVSVFQSGIPFRSLEAVQIYDVSQSRNAPMTPGWSWSMTPPDSLPAVSGPYEHLLLLLPHRPLPLRPVLPGFTLNTVIYAVIAAALCVAPSRVRAFVRHRRGLCLCCGYDARDLDVCPECGHARVTEQRAVVAGEASGE